MSEYWNESAERLIRATSNKLGLDAMRVEHRQPLTAALKRDDLFPNHCAQMEEIIAAEGLWQRGGSFEEMYPFTPARERSITVETALRLMENYSERCSSCREVRPIVEVRGEQHFCERCWLFVSREFRNRAVQRHNARGPMRFLRSVVFRKEN